MIWTNENLLKILQAGGVAVMPTDTIYGIVGSALDVATVERIYKLRKRSPDKPCIILIGDIDELEKFSINLSEAQKSKIKEYWILEETQDFKREPTSIIFDCPDDKFSYLHCGTKTLAFRLPFLQELRSLLLKTGPLIAPSANTEKFPASENIEDAKNYFGAKVDFYLDGGQVTSKASKVIKLLKDGSVSIIRE